MKKAGVLLPFDWLDDCVEMGKEHGWDKSKTHEMFVGVMAVINPKDRKVFAVPMRVFAESVVTAMSKAPPPPERMDKEGIEMLAELICNTYCEMVVMKNKGFQGYYIRDDEIKSMEIGGNSDDNGE